MFLTVRTSSKIPPTSHHIDLIFLSMNISRLLSWMSRGEDAM